MAGGRDQTGGEEGRRNSVAWKKVCVSAINSILRILETTARNAYGNVWRGIREPIKYATA